MAVRKKGGATLTKAPKQKQHVNWRQRLRNMAAASALLLLLVGTVYLQQDDTLPVLHVTVEGEFRHADQSELVEAVTPFVLGSFIAVDVASIRQAGEALPWIKQVQVRRVWPDTLHLIVEEQQAIARWNDVGLVNTSGQVFYPPVATLPKEKLVQLNGPNGSSELMTTHLVEIQQQVAQLGMKVETLQMDQRRAWQVEFTDGLKLVLGRAENTRRLQRFIKVFSGGLKRYQHSIAGVDMRYTNGLSVIWKQGQKPDFNGTV